MHEDPLVTICKRQQQGLEPAEKIMLQSGISGLADVDNDVSVGTACSGTDVLNHTLDILLGAWAEQYGIRLTRHHMFSVENIEFKRIFLYHHWKPTFVFEDIGSLCDAQVRDTISGRFVAVPDVTIFAVGIECDSISGLNSHSVANRGCIGRQQHKTGITAAGAFQFIELKKPMLVLIENVRNLNAPNGTAKTDLCTVVEKLYSFGYKVCFDIVAAHKHGMPQRQDRYYWIALLASAEPITRVPRPTDDDREVPKWI